jgi:hypothetical protein
MGSEPDVDALVGCADGAGFDHMRDKEAEPYREGGDQSEAPEHDGEEDGDRVAAAEQGAEPLREPSRGWREHELIRPPPLSEGRGLDGRGRMRFDRDDEGRFPFTTF